MEGFYVWWLSEAEYTKIPTEVFDTLPTYLAEECRSRDGRNGRGRLWISSKLNAPTGSQCEWDDRNPVCQKIVQESAGGIFFLPEDLGRLPKDIGFVTDQKCHFVPTH